MKLVILREPRYGMDDRGVEVRVSERSRIFSSLYRPDRLGAQPTYYPMGVGGSFPRGKAAGA
jgi:hypothetical protein